MKETLFNTVVGQGPLVAAAVHDGHEVREEVSNLLALSELERLREEDPYTGMWTTVAPTQIVVRVSRFEVDLNRPRERAVYVTPEDAWGLQVWKETPAKDLVERSRAEYDRFYGEIHRIFTKFKLEVGKFVVFDLHSYNHRRSGSNGAPADPNENPEINIGTGSMDRQKWAPVVDQFLSDLRSFDFHGRKLDVRENVKFRGGQFPRWIHQNFPDSACALAIEFKKLFMDEWTGQPDPIHIDSLRLALQSTVPGVLDKLGKLNGNGIRKEPLS